MRNGLLSRNLERVRKRRESKPSPIGDQEAQADGSDHEAGKSQPAGRAPQAHEKSWHPDEARHHRIERFYWGLTAFLTFLAVAGAVATVVISNWTLEEAQKATGEAHRQANEAKRQADIAEKAFVESDRPIIKISFDQLDVLGATHNNRTTLQINAANIGAKPAFVAYIRAQIILGGDTPPKEMVSDDCQWALGEKTVAVGEVEWVRCSAKTLTFDDAFNATKFTSKIYVIGEVQYRSTFGAIWQQHFCYYWFPGTPDNPARMENVNDSSLNYEVRVDKPETNR